MEYQGIDITGTETGSYIIDTGEQVAVGCSAGQVAELLESEQYRDSLIYRVHRASPDGRMELHGVAVERFLAESGMFFHARTAEQAHNDYDRLAGFARTTPPPCRAVLHLAEQPLAPSPNEASGQSEPVVPSDSTASGESVTPVGSDGASKAGKVAKPPASSSSQWLIALIYPAEYESEIASWFAGSGYVGAGPVDAGVSQVTRYRQAAGTIHQRTQLWPESSQQYHSAQQSQQSQQSLLSQALGPCPPLRWQEKPSRAS